jgi:hypothetical protein
LIKSETDNYNHWNQELKLSNMINNPRRNPEFFNRENSKRKLDIWYYTKVKKGSIIELNLNIIGVTIPWNDVIINSEKFDNSTDPSYIHATFNSKDIEVSALTNARPKKVDKYKPIVDEAKIWLQENLDEIRIKRKVSNINVNCRFIVISNLGII